MAEQIYSENAKKISREKKLIEQELKVKINIKENIIEIEGKAEDEYLTLLFIQAMDLGFSIPKALLLKEEGFFLEKIPIKAIAHRRNLSQVRGRVIGKERKVLDTIESLTDTNIALHNNFVGIIGRVEDVEKASYVLKRIIAGSKHATMYAWLEKKKADEKLMS
jgi:ribosomal RNA assembly protein